MTAPIALFAHSALLPGGWARNVRIDVGTDGAIAAVHDSASADGAEALAGPVVPAMPNAHSHAFQRVLAGRTGRASPQDDNNFWSWRQAMYACLDRLDADAFEAVTAQAYVEMAKAGYAAVAEFHYVHHDPAGRPYADPAELAGRVIAAAETAGLALTLLPVFYAHAGFGGTPATAGQRRFVHAPYTYAQLFERLATLAGTRDFVLGVAPHSLRAVTPEELRNVVALSPPGSPIHIHVAEQTREVDDCVAWSGLRPVDWLLAHARVDARWCVVHATHITERELQGLAASGGVVALAPTTEADLGDGTFPAVAYRQAGGRFAIGSDSNTVIDPFGELRLLEYSQRLRQRHRNLLTEGDVPVGRWLWTAAAAGGAQACGRGGGSIAAGAPADLVVLDADEPALVGHAPETMLDAAIFGPCRKPVRDVLRGGRFIVREGRHPQEDAVFARYRAAVAKLSG
jgi:formimidoylglutamate deiminase